VIDNYSSDNAKNILTLMEDYFDNDSLNFSYHINSKKIGLDGSMLFIGRNILFSRGVA